MRDLIRNCLTDTYSSCYAVEAVNFGTGLVSGLSPWCVPSETRSTAATWPAS